MTKSLSSSSFVYVTHYTRQVQLAYVAGLIDGEGSFWISENNYGTIQISFQVKMAHRSAIEIVQSVLGGAIYTYDAHYASYKSVAGRHKNPQYGCRLTGRAVVVAAEELFPYLVVKAPQAKVAMLYGSTCIAKGQRLTEAQHEIRKHCLLTMKELNGRL